jgi:hypothetical protein
MLWGALYLDKHPEKGNRRQHQGLRRISQETLIARGKGVHLQTLPAQYLGLYKKN